MDIVNLSLLCVSTPVTIILSIVGTIIVEKIIGYGNEYFENEMVFTKRAKRVLETAWEYAKKQHKTKIESADLLWAITTEPDSLAMQALEQLGTDVVEIREGIKKHTLKQ